MKDRILAWLAAITMVITGCTAGGPASSASRSAPLRETAAAEGAILLPSPSDTAAPSPSPAASVESAAQETASVPAGNTSVPEAPQNTEEVTTIRYTEQTPIQTVMNDPVFGNWGRLIFPVHTQYWHGNRLGDLNLAWYRNIDPAATVEVTNYFREHAEAGETVFYPIYTDAEIAADPAKADTGLFFFRGRPGARFAICCAGGGFAYVGAMHDSFPHALEISKHGFNAFAIIYRPGAQTACEDLARAISFVFANADALRVDTSCYSLWGGSAGARMAAWLGSLGPAAFGGDNLPKPGAVIMEYTGHSEYNSSGEPPTFVAVGDRDGIANWQVMQQRVDTLASMGVPTEFHVYPGLGHGFGLGTGTVAEGWIEEAIAFWKAQMPD